MKRLFIYIISVVGTFIVFSFILIYIDKNIKALTGTSWLFLFFAVAFSGLTFYFYAPGMHSALKTMRGALVMLPIAAVLLWAFLSIHLASPEHSDLKVISSAGAVFVVVMAIITVCGFLLTITRLEDIHGRIQSYSYLLERINALVKIELDRVNNELTDRTGMLYIFANAPAIGNVSVPSEYKACSARLSTLIDHQKVNVKICCLSDIRDFYVKHWGNVLTTSDLNEKIFESENMISEIHSSPNYEIKKQVYKLKPEFLEVPFHLFLTSERAIIYTALSFPESELPENTSANLKFLSHLAEEDHSKWTFFNDLIRNHMNKYHQVQIIGFETGDRSVREALKDAFEKRLKVIADLSIDKSNSTSPVSKLTQKTQQMQVIVGDNVSPSASENVVAQNDIPVSSQENNSLNLNEYSKRGDNLIEKRETIAATSNKNEEGDQSVSESN